MNSPEKRLEDPNPVPIVLLVCVFVVVDLTIPQVIGSGLELLFVFLLGTVCGQFCLMAIWTVLGRRRLLVRVPVALLVTMLLCGMSFLRTPSAYGHELTLSLTVPLLFLAVQLPLWVLRFAVGCRIVPASAAEHFSSMPPRQFRLQHMLVATGVIALALGLPGLGLSPQGQAADYEHTVMWLRLGVGCLLCCIWSTFAALPCLWAAFRAPGKVVASIGMGAYVLAMSFVAVLILNVFETYHDYGEDMIMFLWFHTGMVAAILGALHVVRSCGYVLRWVPHKGPPVPPTSTNPGPADIPPSDAPQTG